MCSTALGLERNHSIYSLRRLRCAKITAFARFIYTGYARGVPHIVASTPFRGVVQCVWLVSYINDAAAREFQWNSIARTHFWRPPSNCASLGLHKYIVLYTQPREKKNPKQYIQWVRMLNSRVLARRFEGLCAACTYFSPKNHTQTPNTHTHTSSAGSAHAMYHPPIMHIFAQHKERRISHLFILYWSEAYIHRIFYLSVWVVVACWRLKTCV